jgi:hypothetical protein
LMRLRARAWSSYARLARRRAACSAAARRSALRPLRPAEAEPRKRKGCARGEDLACESAPVAFALSPMHSLRRADTLRNSHAVVCNARRQRATHHRSGCRAIAPPERRRPGTLARLPHAGMRHDTGYTLPVGVAQRRAPALQRPSMIVAAAPRRRRPPPSPKHGAASARSAPCPLASARAHASAWVHSPGRSVPGNEAFRSITDVSIRFPRRESAHHCTEVSTGASCPTCTRTGSGTGLSARARPLLL